MCQNFTKSQRDFPGPQIGFEPKGWVPRKKFFFAPNIDEKVFIRHGKSILKKKKIDFFFFWDCFFTDFFFETAVFHRFWTKMEGVWQKVLTASDRYLAKFRLFGHPEKKISHFLFFCFDFLHIFCMFFSFFGLTFMYRPPTPLFV